METTIKRTMARENLEMEKLEQSEKSHLRMISSAARLKFKYGRLEDPESTGETEARKIRMYETHNPGFCYLRNGEYRKKLTHSGIYSVPDPQQCCNKIKSILFTDNELDIFKTMCLHLLGTHVQNRHHIQRKDGRLCSYVKSQTTGNAPNTLHPMSQRMSYLNETPSKYDKMLPRYILDVKAINPGVSTTSFKMSDIDSGSDDETKKKRKHVVPIFVNNEIRMIINSVMEALETVESPKMRHLSELASSPEELRNMLTRGEAQEFISELAKNPLVMKPTSYDFVTAHMMFDKIPEKGTLETVAQVLEVYDDFELKYSLEQIRRGILNRHSELINSNIIPRSKAYSVRDEPSVVDGLKISYPLADTTQKHLITHSAANLKQGAQEDVKLNDKTMKNLNNLIPLQKKNQTDLNKKSKSTVRSESRNVSTYSAKLNESPKDPDDSSDEDGRRGSRSSTDSNKSHLHNLTNSQRILLGLKVASLKNRPINLHQFEGKRKVDMAAIISPIIRTQTLDADNKQSSDSHLHKNVTTPEETVKKTVSKISEMATTDLENLTRALLAQLRLEIADTENKKRLNQFMAKI